MLKVEKGSIEDYFRKYNKQVEEAKQEEEKKEEKIIVPPRRGAWRNYGESYIADKKLGIKKEEETLILINRFFNCDFKLTPEYTRFDYCDVNKSIIAELKGRRNTKNKYPDTMIGMNKIDYYYRNYANSGWKVILLFSFSDGLYYYEFKEINKNWIRDGGRRDRAFGEWKKKGYYFIPVKLLKEVKEVKEVKKDKVIKQKELTDYFVSK